MRALNNIFIAQIYELHTIKNDISLSDSIRATAYSFSENLRYCFRLYEENISSPTMRTSFFRVLQETDSFLKKLKEEA